MGRRWKPGGGVFILAMLFCAAPLPAAESPPLLLVADFEYAGISELQMKLLVDLYSYTIFESGHYIVLNRYERNKLLKGFGYNQRNLKDRRAYLEAAELLRARYIVTGSCFAAENGFTLNLTLWDVGSGALEKQHSFTAADVDGLKVAAREATARFLDGERLAQGFRAAASGLTESLYVTAIRERILIALPGAVLDGAAAAARLLVNETAARLGESERAALYFTTASYDVQRPAPSSFAPVLAARDCHTLALIAAEGTSYALVLYNPDFSVKLKLALALRGERRAEADLLARQFEERLPPMDCLFLARELEREIIVKEKLDLLLFNDKFLSQRFFINVHQSVIKPAVAGMYHPLLNIISLEADGYWYYEELFGVGAGYAFSLGYPATIDGKLASHPLVAQHEFRIMPVSFRSAGPVSVIINLVAALALQNAYRIVYFEPIDKYEFLDGQWLFLFKVGINMGILFNITDDLSVFFDLATLNTIIPLNVGAITYDGSRISGALGGLGVIFRF